MFAGIDCCWLDDDFLSLSFSLVFFFLMLLTGKNRLELDSGLVILS